VEGRDLLAEFADRLEQAAVASTRFVYGLDELVVRIREVRRGALRVGPSQRLGRCCGGPGFRQLLPIGLIAQRATAEPDGQDAGFAGQRADAGVGQLAQPHAQRACHDPDRRTRIGIFLVGKRLADAIDGRPETVIALLVESRTDDPTEDVDRGGRDHAGSRSRQVGRCCYGGHGSRQLPDCRVVRRTVGSVGYSGQGVGIFLQDPHGPHRLCLRQLKARQLRLRRACDVKPAHGRIAATCIDFIVAGTGKQYPLPLGGHFDLLRRGKVAGETVVARRKGLSHLIDAVAYGRDLAGEAVRRASRRSEQQRQDPH
jgi:hypothetical protein